MRILRTPLQLAAIVAASFTGACSPQTPETAASPVMGASRTVESVQGMSDNNSYHRQGDNGALVGKILAPAPAVWDALVAAMADRKVNLTLIDHGVGRLGDTSMVLIRRFNGQPLSRFFDCGSSMTGQRADEDRLRAVFLAQMTRLAGDTVGVAVHMSAFATPLAQGGSGSTA